MTGEKLSISSEGRGLIILSELIFSLLFLGFAAVNNSALHTKYQQDLKENYLRCLRMTDHYEIMPDCQGFWFKTLNDPSVFWNFLYTCLTLLLVFATFITIYITNSNIKTQRSDVKHLFVMDQRPWLKVDCIPQPRSISFDKEGNLNIKIAICIRNIGKTAAVQVSTSQFLSIQDNLATLGNARPLFDILRKQAQQLMPVGKTLLPADQHTSEAVARITRKELEATWDQEDVMRAHILMHSIFYKSVFDENQKYEVSLCLALTFLGALAPTPRDLREMENLKGNPELRMLYLSKIS